MVGPEGAPVDASLMRRVRHRPPMVDAPLLSRALELAITAHEGQRRKGGRVPYAVHPMRVVGRVHAWGVTDEEVLAAAALHDAVEDTPVRRDQIELEFGARVAGLVDALTHPNDLAPRERTRFILDALERAPLEALVVKLADRLDNVLDMPGWRASSRLGYLGESADVARLARRRLSEDQNGSQVAREALERALPEYETAVERARQKAQRDLDAERSRGRRRR